MSKSKRNTYLVLMAVQNICEGMQRTDATAKDSNTPEDRLHPNSRASIKRILAKIQDAMPTYQPKTASDGRFMMDVATKLRIMWADDESRPRPVRLAGRHACHALQPHGPGQRSAGRHEPRRKAGA